MSIVITGVGLVTALGTSAEQTWRGVLRGVDGRGPMPALETAAPPPKGGYQAAELPADFCPELPREPRYLRWAVVDALRQAAALDVPAGDARRCGLVLGTTLHGMRAGGRFLRTGDFGQLRSFLAGGVARDAVAGLPIGGDATTVCSACSSSLGSVALAVTLLESGALDRVVAGGYDGVSEYAFGGFNALRLVADGPPRPFAKDRRGMNVGEGYGVLVLERAGDAAARGAEPLAVVRGWGESADAHHLTQPDPHGTGAAAAIAAALARAGVAPAEVGLVAAHATATPDNDAGEAAALAATLGDALPGVPVVGLKSHLGHTLGGAGAVELILSAMAIRDGLVPATAGVAAADVGFAGLAVASGGPRRADVRVTLNTSLGFGGANTAVVLGKADGAGPSPARGGAVLRPAADATGSTPPPRAGDGPAPSLVRDRAVFVTGVGVVLPGAVGVDAFRSLLAGDRPMATGPVPDAAYAGLLDARRTRRVSGYVRLSLAATALAVADAGFAPLPPSACVLLGTCHGSASYCVDYYRKIVDGGSYLDANPVLFAEGVPNAAAAHLSLAHGLRGACQTVIGTRTAGLDALRLAAARIAAGDWDVAVVGAAEEHSDLVDRAYAAAGLCGGGGFVTGAGAVTLVLESAESVARRGGRVRGRVGASAAARFASAAGAVGAVRHVVGALGGVGRVCGSGNRTWVDRVERAAGPVDGLYGRLPELFAAGPLAAVAAAVVAHPVTTRGVLGTDYAGSCTAVAIHPAPPR